MGRYEMVGCITAWRVLGDMLQHAASTCAGGTSWVCLQLGWGFLGGGGMVLCQNCKQDSKRIKPYTQVFSHGTPGQFAATCSLTATDISMRRE